jgi:hypothetical protein
VGQALALTTINFAPVEDPAGRLGHREMPMPNEGDIVALDAGQYRIVRLETHRVTLLHEPWLVLVNVARVEVA